MTFPDPPEEIAAESMLRELVDVLELALATRGFQRYPGLGWSLVGDVRRPRDLVAGWDRRTVDSESEHTMNGVSLFLDGRILIGLDRNTSLVLYARPGTDRRRGSDLMTLGAGLAAFIDKVDERLGTIVLPRHSA